MRSAQVNPRRSGRFARKPIAAAIGLILVVGALSAPVAAATSPLLGYRLPWRAGESHKVTQGWGNPYSHTGTNYYAYDFSMPVGTPIVAAARGTVAYAVGKYTACGGSELINKANYVIINHSDGHATQYAHLSRVDVTKGQVVAPGQQIGLSGAVGYTSCGPHLHFMVEDQSTTAAFTQSVPYYFDEHPSGPLTEGTSYKSGNPACSQAAGAMPVDAFCGQYYKGTFSGPQYMSRVDPTLAFNWGTSGPGGPWFKGTTGNYSARWVGSFAFSHEGWTFRMTTSDGIKLYIDNMTTPVVTQWANRSAPASYTWSTTMSAGYHTIKVEYYDDTGAGLVNVSWDNCGTGIC
jgi:murein DD-endopeptidase MepM/ murein hydrolase activator NlpD